MHDSRSDEAMPSTTTQIRRGDLSPTDMGTNTLGSYRVSSKLGSYQRQPLVLENNTQRLTS